MGRDRMEAQACIPTSVHLSKMLDRADEARVSIRWLMEQLGRRSFGLTLFLMAANRPPARRLDDHRRAGGVAAVQMMDGDIKPLGMP